MPRSVLARRPAILITAAGLCFSLSAFQAHAQSFMSGITGWNFPAAPAGTTSDSGDSDWAYVPASPDGLLLRLRANGFAREDRDAGGIADNAAISFKNFTYEFNLTANADVVVPMLLDGRVTLASPAAGNRSQFSVTSTSILEQKFTFPIIGDVWVPIGAPVTRTRSYDATIDAAGNHDLAYTDFARWMNPGAGSYRVTSKMSLSANANGGVPGTPGVGPANSRVTFDFNTDASNYGAFYSVSAEPASYQTSDSRSAVGANLAESIYHVTGANARIGMVESGKVFENHADMNFGVGGRFTNLDNASGLNVTGEHATAVASIIAGGSGNAAKRGVAPSANLVAASSQDFGTRMNAFNAIRNSFGAGNAGVINFSAQGSPPTREALDNFMNANANITFVAAAGNTQPGVANIPEPNNAYNIIAVGALEADYRKVASFSLDTGGAQPIAPHVVAPGSFVLSASTRDISNAGGAVTDYTRTFLGSNINRAGGHTTGDISGTSFAAPHVTGAVALLHELGDKMGHDARAKDQRVMKAVVIAGATTANITDKTGGLWSQQSSLVAQPGTTLQARRVTQSLHSSLGGGLLSAPGSLSIFHEKEARVADNSGGQNFNIDMRSRVTAGETAFWDLQSVNAAVTGPVGQGTVNYLFGGGVQTSDLGGNVVDAFSSPLAYIRVALTWNRDTPAATYAALSNLELGLFIDGLDASNHLGFHPADNDFRLAFTSNIEENVKLFDFSIPSTILSNQLGYDGSHPLLVQKNMYLQVANYSGTATEYGLAVSFIPVPLPGVGVLMLTITGVLSTRRRR